MRRKAMRDLIDRALDQPSQDMARQVMRQLREQIATGPSQGYNMALLRDAAKGSNISFGEFPDDCITQLTSTYNHPPLGGAGAFTYEAPTRFLDAPNPPVLAPGTTSPASRIEFTSTGGGIIVGILGSVRDETSGDDVSLTNVSVQLVINGGENLNTDGQTQTFTSYGNLFRLTAPYFPFRRLVSSRDFMDVVWRSNATVASALTIIPELTLCFGRLAQIPF